MRISPILIFVAATAFLLPLQAESPTPTPFPPAKPAPPGQNILTGFAPGKPQASLWYGVDATGALAGNTTMLPVLTLGGAIGNTPMPVSVSVADMNGDGLLDIAVMDALGYLRIYFNSGTKTAPKFTTGDLSSIFLTRTSATDPDLPLPLKDVEWWTANSIRSYARRAPRIFLTDKMGAVKNDLLIGNYAGELLFVPNTGTPSIPDFKQPPSVAQAVIPTMKDSHDKWGNVFAPVVWDWNNDGRSDILVGEGSYSANSIHLLINKGSNDRPVFDENNRSVLAYGMGLEQLSPCVVDFNGDGFPDLLVAERSGKVAVYLNSGKPWKPGETLAFDSFIKTGVAFTPSAPDSKPDPMTDAKAPGLLSLGGACTIAAADLNGDGLFDLVFGKSNGRIAIAYNTGTKTQPKFSAPVEVTSDAKASMFTPPAEWLCDSGLMRGNFFGQIASVNASDDPDAKPGAGPYCLKAGYMPCQNKIMVPPPAKYYTPSFGGWDPAPNTHTSTTVGPSGFWHGIGENEPIMFCSPANFYRLKFPVDQLKNTYPIKIKKPYIFSMRVKGAGVSDACVNISCYVRKELSETKLIRGERGSVGFQLNWREGWKNETIKFAPGAQWTEVKKEFTVNFGNKDLEDQTQVEPRWWSINIVFSLVPGTGSLYFDDIKLIEK